MGDILLPQRRQGAEEEEYKEIFEMLKTRLGEISFFKK